MPLTRNIVVIGPGSISIDIDTPVPLHFNPQRVAHRFHVRRLVAMHRRRATGYK